MIHLCHVLEKYGFKLICILIVLLAAEYNYVFLLHAAQENLTNNLCKNNVFVEIIMFLSRSLYDT